MIGTMVMVPTPIFQAANRYKLLRNAKERLEAELKLTNKSLEAAEIELIDLMIGEEIGKFSHEGTTLYLSSQLHATCPAANRREVRAWLSANRQDDILFDSVDDKKLTRYIKGLLEEADELPEGLNGLVSVFEKQTVCIRKPKEAKENGN